MAVHGPPDEKQIIILKALCYLKQEQSRAVLRKADISLIRCICECALNILRGNVGINNEQKKQLRKHATTLRRLAAKNGNWGSKRRLIVQRGAGFLKLLIQPVIQHISHGAR